VLTSLKQGSEVLRLPVTLWPDNIFYLDNYRSIFQQLPIGRFLLNSVAVTVLSIVPSLFFSSLAGYAFAKLDFPGKEVCFILVIATLITPFEAKLIPLFILASKLHLVNTYLGISAPRMISPLGVFFMRQFVQTVPDDYLNAARIDGSTELQVFWWVAMPIMRPAIFTLAIILFIFSWNDFLWPLAIVQDQSMMTITVGITLLGNQFYVDYTKITAAAAVTVAPILVLYFVLQRQVIQGMVGSGLKG